jgi:hypothetical protein
LDSLRLLGPDATIRLDTSAKDLRELKVLADASQHVMDYAANGKLQVDTTGDSSGRY